MKKSSAVLFAWAGFVLATAAAHAASGQLAAGASCPAIPKARASDAERAFSRGQFADAERLFAAMPSSDISEAGQVRALIGQGRPGAALTLALRAVAEHPESALALDALAEVRFASGEADEALAGLNKALALDPCLPMAHYDLSLYLDLSGMAAAAQKELDLAYRIAPADPLIRRAWKATQEPVPTPQSQIAEMREIASRPNETAAQKAEIEGVIRTLEADGRGDCELVTSPNATIPLIPMFAQGRQMPSTGSELEVVLNGKKRHLLVDTGATGMTISREAADGLGLTPEAEVGSAGVGDGGANSEFVAHIASMKIGSLELRNCKVRVQTQRHGLNIEGLFGPDTLRSMLLAFDFPKHELRTSALPALKDVPAPTIAASRRDRYVPPGMERWSPVFREAQNLIVSTSIGNAPRKLFILDTGMEIGLIAPEVARQVTTVTARPGDSVRGVSGVTHNVSASGPVSVAFSGFTGRVKEMTVMDDISGFIPRGSVQEIGFFGYDLLQQVVLEIDYRDNLIRVTPAR